jgi:hypothetical protein
MLLDALAAFGTALCTCPRRSEALVEQTAAEFDELAAITDRSRLWVDFVEKVPKSKVVTDLPICATTNCFRSKEGPSISAWCTPKPGCCNRLYVLHSLT